MNNQYICYVDIDGTLSDFEKHASHIVGKKFSNSSEDWKKIEEYNEHTPFFESLPKMTGANKLINFVKDNFSKYCILTANDTGLSNGDAQKRKWVKKHFGNIQVKIVRKGPAKAYYANPHTILIDNEEANIKAWKKAGGIGVLFTDTTSCINKLKKLTS